MRSWRRSMSGFSALLRLIRYSALWIEVSGVRSSCPFRFGRIHVGQREIGELPVLSGYIDHAPVRQAGHRETRHAGEGGLIVERRSERTAGLQQEALCFLGPLPLFHLAF